MEQLRPGAAHLADDHLALSEQKAPGEKRRVGPGVWAEGHPCSPQVAFDEGKARLELKVGPVSGEKTAVETPLCLIVCEP